MTKTVLIETATNVVTAVILIGDEIETYVPAPGLTAIHVPDNTYTGPGCIWNGTEFLPSPPEPPVVPTKVTARQAKLALLAAGFYSAVEQAIEAMPSPHKEMASIEWNSAKDFERASPWIAALGTALDLTSAQIDELFIAASGL